ncbi:unnamed protein product [Urochloa humidicola]
MDGESSGGRQLKRRRKEPLAGADWLSKLDDVALGHILSFLPAKEAARAAVLSPRWRHVFAAVHTVSLKEPEGTDKDDGGNRGRDSPSDDRHRHQRRQRRHPPSFPSAVSAAIIARQRRRGAAAPLRALRVAMERYRGREDSSTVDLWVSHAVQQAAPGGLDLDLRIWCRRMLCDRPYALREGNNEAGPEPEMFYPPLHSSPSPTVDDNNDDDEEGDERHVPRLLCDPPEYIIPRLLFSCAELRSLSLSSCRLAPPRTVITLPSLVTLHLSHAPDGSAGVARLVAGCPRLADLTLEMCEAVTALAVHGGARLRRLALRCCHNLATVTVDDSSELRAFEYMGAVPDNASFLTMHGGTGRVGYCKVDICGAEATSEEELTNLRHLLQQFVNAKHLHLESDRLGSGFHKDVPAARSFADFSGLRHLEMRGCLPVGDDGVVIDAMRRVLEHSPNLEALSLAFHPKKHEWGVCHDYETDYCLEEELDAEHHLSYNPNSVLATPSAMIPCLRNKVREINLVHYHGGTAQRALAKFLLCNAPGVQELWCEFAAGPMWTQVQLMREIKGWLINKSANTHFA